MAFEVSALRGEPRQDLVAEDDYQSFSEALGSSARGRAFLAEYARRNRHADTAIVLAALDRLEALARSQKAAPETERIRQDLRALLDTLQSAKPQIDLSPGAIKAATLSALLEFVQARIEALVGPTAAPAPAPGVRSFLSPVPQSDEPELPIPRPGASAQPSITLVQTITPPVDAEPVTSPTADPMVLSLDPRVGPVFGELAEDAPRPANVIADINFIDALVVRGKTEVATDDSAAPLTPPSADLPDMPDAAMTPPPSFAVLPPLELTASEPAVAQRQQATLDTAGLDAETTARTEALVRATHATADAIDNIVAAAAALMADEAAAAATITDVSPVETAPVEMAIAETAVAETIVVETITAETPIAEIVFGEAGPGQIAPADANLPEIGFVAAESADVEVAQATAAETMVASTFEPLTFPAESQTPNAAMAAPEFAVAPPSPQVRDDALAAIMAMSEEERLALFT